MARFDGTRALELLRLGCENPTAQFREGQREAIQHVVEGRGPLLLIQKTGWGKSYVYFIATKLLREAGSGPTLLISPLLALMRDQIRAAKRMGLEAATINSTNPNDWSEVEERILCDEIDLLLISPERLANERFREGVLASVADTIELLVIDEAHCISDWGHDFRPDYRRIEDALEMLPKSLRLLATTATANERVQADLNTILGPDLHVMRGSLNRPSLTLQTIRLEQPEQRLAWLAEHLDDLEGSGIIYTLTVRSAYMVAEWLKNNGFSVEAYTSKSGDQRPELEQALRDNQLKALVATTALGMGFDKPDLAFVIHYHAPGSVVTYYQQVGRAGRALENAYGILLSGQEETDITNHFIETAFPTRDTVDLVLHALEQEPEGFSILGLMGEINLPGPRIRKALKLLALESPPPIEKLKCKWKRTDAALRASFWERPARLIELRRQEQLEMRRYVDLPFGLHMPFLIQALGGDPSTATAPKLPPLPNTIRPAMLEKASAFLRGFHVPIEPRKQWPAGGMPAFDVRGTIPEDQRAQPGKALCWWASPHWGDLVRTGKYHDGRFSDALVAACVRLVEHWQPDPAPKWVTCIPSLRSKELVPDFARRLAEALHLPFLDTLKKTKPTRPQKDMQNPIQQALNLDGSLAIMEDPHPDPVLLVDDIADSRWTLTVAAWLLRTHGSGEVWPLTLAYAGPTR